MTYPYLIRSLTGQTAERWFLKTVLWWQWRRRVVRSMLDARRLVRMQERAERVEIRALVEFHVQRHSPIAARNRVHPAPSTPGDSE